MQLNRKQKNIELKSIMFNLWKARNIIYKKLEINMRNCLKIQVKLLQKNE